MKLELVLTRWEDGLFKSRDRIEADSISSLEGQIETMMDDMRKKIVQEENIRYKILETDDDIPF